MSGGSMNYLYSKLEYAEFKTDTPERKAFAKHLKLVAKALHDIEWVDSADYGDGDENEAIRACLTANARWESALGAVMPADFKCWHQNAKSELPEIAAGVIENLRQREADAWEQSAAAVAKERERCAQVANGILTQGRSPLSYKVMAEILKG